jgi:hypothetical protein
MMKKKLIIILFLFLSAAYPFIKEYWAHEQVEFLFNEVTVGMPVEEFKARAKDLGLKVDIVICERTGSNPGEMIAWEGWAFARWLCQINHIAGKVTQKEIIFLD